MPRLINTALISIRDLLVTALPFILLGIVLLSGAYFLLVWKGGKFWLLFLVR